MMNVAVDKNDWQSVHRERIRRVLLLTRHNPNQGLLFFLKSSVTRWTISALAVDFDNCAHFIEMDGLSIRPPQGLAFIVPFAVSFEVRHASCSCLDQSEWRVSTAVIVSFAELIEVIAVHLTALIVTAALNEDNQAILLKAGWTDVVYWLAVCHFSAKFVHYVAFRGGEYLVTRFFLFEFVFFSQFLAELFQCITELDVHHVRGGQLNCQAIQQLRSLPAVWSFVGREELLEHLGGRRRLSCHSYRRRRQTEGDLKLRDVHTSNSSPRPCACKRYRVSPRIRNHYRGVKQYFPHLPGTGGGRDVRDLQANLEKSP